MVMEKCFTFALPQKRVFFSLILKRVGEAIRVKLVLPLVETLPFFIAASIALFSFMVPVVLWRLEEMASDLVA